MTSSALIIRKTEGEKLTLSGIEPGTLGILDQRFTDEPLWMLKFLKKKLEGSLYQLLNKNVRQGNQQLTLNYRKYP